MPFTIIHVGCEEVSVWKASGKLSRYRRVQSISISDFNQWYIHSNLKYEPCSWVLQNLRVQVLPVDESEQYPLLELESCHIQLSGGFFEAKSNVEEITQQLLLKESYSSYQVIHEDFLRFQFITSIPFTNCIFEGREYYFVTSNQVLVGIHSKSIFSSSEQIQQFVEAKYYLSGNTTVETLPSVSFEELLIQSVGFQDINLYSYSEDLFHHRLTSAEWNLRLQVPFKWFTMGLVISLVVWFGLLGSNYYRLSESQSHQKKEWAEFEKLQKAITALKESNLNIIELESHRTSNHYLIANLTKSKPSKIWVQELQTHPEYIQIIGYAHSEKQIDQWLLNLEKLSLFPWVKLKYSEWLSNSRMKRKAGIRQTQKPLYKFFIEVGK